MTFVSTCVDDKLIWTDRCDLFLVLRDPQLAQ